jgi:lysophospholipase L1-like esterase
MNEMAWRDALAFKPDIVVIKLGTNDSKPQNWQYGKEFKQDLEQMIKELRAVSPKARIILCTPIPAFKSSWDINESVIVNDIIPIQQKVAKKQGLQVIDLHTLFANSEDLVLPDGIHPNGKGAERMADIISEQLMNQKK